MRVGNGSTSSTDTSGYIHQLGLEIRSGDGIQASWSNGRSTTPAESRGFPLPIVLGLSLSTRLALGGLVGLTLMLWDFFLAESQIAYLPLDLPFFLGKPPAVTVMASIWYVCFSSLDIISIAYLALVAFVLGPCSPSSVIPYYNVSVPLSIVTYTFSLIIFLFVTYIVAIVSLSHRYSLAGRDRYLHITSF